VGRDIRHDRIAHVGTEAFKLHNSELIYQ